MKKIDEYLPTKLIVLLKTSKKAPNKRKKF